jgi:subtilisin family serine protease
LRLIGSLAILGACAVLPASAAASGDEPYDPFLHSQWALSSRAGVNPGPVWGLGLGAPVTVAVVDTGVDLASEDLAAARWTNWDELPGNGLDDDGNGYVDDRHGFDFVSRDGDPTDDNDHGTAMASLIAARGNDGYAMAGVAWNARIMAVKAADSDGRTTNREIAEGIAYAVANGARVINLSMAVDSDSASFDLRNAVRAAAVRGVPIVAAAGNAALDLDSHDESPDWLTEPNVIAVAATAKSGRLWPWSNRGRRVVDVAAPGAAVFAAKRGGEYSEWSGTSPAAAHVSGSLALLAGLYPRWRGERLQRVLLAGARPGIAGVSAGSVDVAGALAVIGAASKPRARRSTEVHRLKLRWRRKSR